MRVIDSNRYSAQHATIAALTSGRLISPSPLSPDTQVELHERRAAIDHALSTLSPREEKVITMRFGLGCTGIEYSLAEVGELFGVTRERIRQIEAKALRKLRHPDRAHILAPFAERALRVGLSELGFASLTTQECGMPSMLNLRRYGREGCAA